MTGTRLTRQLGESLRRERQRARLTQHQLATAAEVSQTTVAHLERATRTPSLAIVERLFDALGRQLRLEVEHRDADLDREISRSLRETLTERITNTGIGALAADLAAGGIPYVIDRAAAALLQGAPVPADPVDIALRWDDADRLTDWLSMHAGQRWNERWKDWDYERLDPRLAGPPLWQVYVKGYVVRLQASIGNSLPSCIEVRHAGQTFPVRPGPDLVLADPHTDRLLRRGQELRRRDQSAP